MNTMSPEFFYILLDGRIPNDKSRCRSTSYYSCTGEERHGRIPLELNNNNTGWNPGNVTPMEWTNPKVVELSAGKYLLNFIPDVQPLRSCIGLSAPLPRITSGVIIVQSLRDSSGHS